MLNVDTGDISSPPVALLPKDYNGSVVAWPVPDRVLVRAYYLKPGMAGPKVCYLIVDLRTGEQVHVPLPDVDVNSEELGDPLAGIDWFIK